MVLALIEESVVPVASKNTSSGEIPVSRTVLTLSVSGPLEPVQAAGGGAPELTVTVADWVVVPPDPVQLSV